MKTEADAAKKSLQVCKDVVQEITAKGAVKRTRRSKRSTAGMKALDDDFTVPVYQR